MTPKSSKNFYLFGGISIAIFVSYVLYASTDVPAEATVAYNTEGQTESVTADKTGSSETTVATTTADSETASNVPTDAAKTVMPMLFNSFVEGEHYITKFPNDTLAKEPVVIEFFSYQCPHCYRLEGTINRWEKNHKPENVKLIKVPVSFSGNVLYANAAQAHYIAEKLGLMETFPDRMFKRIHIDRRPLRNERDMIAFFAEFGVSEADFKAAQNSFEVKSKLRRADVLMNKYQVNGVPYVLINYKYELGQKAWESEETLFNVWSNLPLKDFQ